jgi:hypothetical protein
MVGHWKGYYKFEKERIQKMIGFEKTYFEITIEKFDGINFSGSVNDDITTGGMEETGKIIGKVEKDKISFQKLMPLNDQINLKGERIKTNQKHPTLYYSGTFSENKTAIVGTWKFKRRIEFIFGIIPIPFNPGNGFWEMNFSSENILK